MPLDWLAMIAAGAALLEGATMLVKKFRPGKTPSFDKPPDPSIRLDGVETRLAAIENHEQEQGAFLRDLAAQVNALTIASKILNRKIVASYVFGAVALVAAVLATVTALR